MVRGTSGLSVAQLREHLDQALAQGNWSLVAAVNKPGTSTLTSDWKFKGRDGKPWAGTAEVEPVAGRTGQYIARLTIARTS